MAKKIKVPPSEVLCKAQLTRQDIVSWPEFFNSGVGLARAYDTDCPHGYRLTDSCPGCDSDAEEEEED